MPMPVIPISVEIVKHSAQRKKERYFEKRMSGNVADYMPAHNGNKDLLACCWMQLWIKVCIQQLYWSES